MHRKILTRKTLPTEFRNDSKKKKERKSYPDPVPMHPKKGKEFLPQAEAQEEARTE